MGQTGRPDYEIVVSAENNAYLLWQCLLFHAACMDVQGFAPTFVVHALGPLLSGFRVLEQHGARVIAAPNYRAGGGMDYPPRNTPGTLAEAAHDREWTLLCDPDLLIVRALPEQMGPLCEGGPLSWEWSWFMDARPIRAWLEGACAIRGIDPARVAAHQNGGSVPHLVHRDLRADLARRWLAATDALIDFGTRTNDMHWVASMWGFTLATWELNIPVAVTRLSQTSHLGSTTSTSHLSAHLLHYSYGDELFNKHDHCTPETAPGAWTKAQPPGDSLTAWLLGRIAAARAWYLERGTDVTDPLLYTR